MTEDLSSNAITVTSDITEQVRSAEERKKVWLSDKADILLASDNKKELIINLIEDFNSAIGVAKQIEKVSREGLKHKTTVALRSSLLQIVRYFEPDFQVQEA